MVFNCSALLKEVSNKVFNSLQYIPAFEECLLKISVDIRTSNTLGENMPTMRSFPFIRKELHMFSDTDEKLNEIVCSRKFPNRRASGVEW
ncbi:hypothetical protein HZH66_012016 [Vespula vulgaris]|uniref:Uncharacterized protein n=1 Tax=Vespula vulgaris TaxID=7454 RepID=A0A834MTR9_VESVU|nr:hypothetical protein HZH66_012016 [Vespula vulgaris]